MPWSFSENTPAEAFCQCIPPTRTICSLGGRILGRMKNLHQARSAPQLVTMRPSEIRVEELTGADQAPAGATSYHQGSVFPLSGLALPPVAPVSLLSHTPCFTVPYFSPSALPAWSLPTLLNLARVPSFHHQPNRSLHSFFKSSLKFHLL